MFYSIWSKAFIVLLHTMCTKVRVGIIGGGVAGATAALVLATSGFSVHLFEQKSSLVDGPPICHLHAGGNLYREISDEQCVTLLQQSIDTIKFYPHAVNIRPTVIAVPQCDPHDPSSLLPRLHLLKNKYEELVREDYSNKVIGETEEYFKLYSKSDLLHLATLPLPTKPTNLDDWIIPFSKHVDLSTIKFPVVIVQEYGLSWLRLAATVDLALNQFENCNIYLNTKVIDIEEDPNNKNWIIRHDKNTIKHSPSSNSSLSNQINDINYSSITEVDYLVNACGFQSGTIDDLISVPRQRWVEFKAAYVSQWESCEGEWPEVIFHGIRGSPKGMAQVTPYADGYFQLHGMTQDITLFDGGLVESNNSSAQPQLPSSLLQNIFDGWENSEIHARTTKAIQHVAQYIPSFGAAKVGGKPLFGAQQIPGNDASLRAADVSFVNNNYARMEIVKASSALSASNKIVQHILESTSCKQMFSAPPLNRSISSSHSLRNIIDRGVELAIEREYPSALAMIAGSSDAMEHLSYPTVRASL